MKYYFLKKYKKNKINETCATPPIQTDEVNLPRFHCSKINILLEKGIIGIEKKVINNNKN